MELSEGCQFRLLNSCFDEYGYNDHIECEVAVARYEKRATSFGRKFVTHAVLCDGHAHALKYTLEVAP